MDLNDLWRLPRIEIIKYAEKYLNTVKNTVVELSSCLFRQPNNRFFWYWWFFLNFRWEETPLIYKTFPIIIYLFKRFVRSHFPSQFRSRIIWRFRLRLRPWYTSIFLLLIELLIFIAASTIPVIHIEAPSDRWWSFLGSEWKNILFIYNIFFVC